MQGRFRWVQCFSLNHLSHTDTIIGLSQSVLQLRLATSAIDLSPAFVCLPAVCDNEVYAPAW
jgi:hypothetical protein